MKNAHITYAFGLGGIETMLRNIVKEQAKYDHEIRQRVINNIVLVEFPGSLKQKYYLSRYRDIPIRRIRCHTCT